MLYKELRKDHSVKETLIIIIGSIWLGIKWRK